MAGDAAATAAEVEHRSHRGDRPARGGGGVPDRPAHLGTHLEEGVSVAAAAVDEQAQPWGRQWQAVGRFGLTVVDAEAQPSLTQALGRTKQPGPVQPIGDPASHLLAHPASFNIIRARKSRFSL